MADVFPAAATLPDAASDSSPAPAAPAPSATAVAAAAAPVPEPATDDAATSVTPVTGAAATTEVSGANAGDSRTSAESERKFTEGAGAEHKTKKAKSSA